MTAATTKGRSPSGRTPRAPRLRTGVDMFKAYEERRDRVRAGKVRWGKWRFRPDNLTVEHDDGYYIDLERMHNSAGVLDWIAQVAGKELRFTAADVGHLVRALDELIELQAHVCSFGKDREFEIRKVLGPVKS